MEWCPIVKEGCKTDCTWFAEGECAFAKLHYISNSLEEIRESIDSLEKTIENKEF
ncbi:hypothetical protein acsn021_03990 [Anaerocolumna cellulosilytica]|uniref:Uncharacterized protein n=1 Tax=Anaerocolumna cellulosilytica TaxID=433286 RepID=A0A6S6R0L5_9FIRM|nr:hypothetical protein [Anaerocolumna cellulosilytica]MBB5197387.1 hypothetical protein [Anaerocolumna cellulosilytica]BCJ92830.1 hypothetical protein acsn021_03990 [Anaerocolumna cellulosilytica]